MQHRAVFENAYAEEHAQLSSLLEVIGESQQLPVHEEGLEERRFRFTAGQRVFPNGLFLSEVLEGHRR